MQEFNPYTFLFENVFYSKIIFFISDDYAIDVMIFNDIYKMDYLFYISVMGAFLGGLVNYLAGYSLRKLEKLEFMSDRVSSLADGEKWFKKIGYLVVIFSCVPLWGGLVTTSAGLFKLKLRIYMPLILLSQAIGYGIKIFY